MTTTEYVTNVTHEILVDECLEMITNGQDRIEVFINRLIERNPYAEDDGSDLSSLIPRMQAKFDAAMQQASFLAEYEKSLNWSITDEN
jgi:hypothetical protein